MASPTGSRSAWVGLERILLAILIGLGALTLSATLFLGPGLLPLVFVFALAAFAVEQLAQREQAHTTIRRAIAQGVPEPITAWGKVARVTGACPDGEPVQKGTRFVVANGQIWPPVCAHAQQTILDVVSRMEGDSELTEAPARYHDASHLIELELYRAPQPHASRAVSENATVRSRGNGAENEPSVTSGAMWLPRAVISGFMATILMSVMFFTAFAVAGLLGSVLPAVGAAGFFREWLLALTTNSVLDLARGSLYVAGTFHIVMGVVWALVYAAIFEPRRSGASWRKGVEFALLPWALSIIVFLPLAGGGLFGVAIGAGPLPILGNLVLHLVYGASLGAVYGPLGDIPADEFPYAGPVDSPAIVAHEERAMARGIMTGAAIGVLVGIAGALMAATSPANVLLGAPPLAFFLVSVLLGATFGCFVGSIAGLSSDRIEPNGRNSMIHRHVS